MSALPLLLPPLPTVAALAVPQPRRQAADPVVVLAVRPLAAMHRPPLPPTAPVSRSGPAPRSAAARWLSGPLGLGSALARLLLCSSNRESGVLVALTGFVGREGTGAFMVLEL